jgi:hypothetical protein
MHQAKKLQPSLLHLRRGHYIEGPVEDLQITIEGLETTESIFSKFLTYLRKYHLEVDLSHYLTTLEHYRNTIQELVEVTYFHVQKDTTLRSAFCNYLNEIGSLRNAIDFEIKEQDLGILVDDVFFSLDKVNKEFQLKFKFKLFCPPVAACAYMSRAVRGPEPDITVLVAIIGTILSGINQKEIEKVASTTKQIDGSISKFKVFLESQGISYKTETIGTLKTLYRVRSTTFPLHDAGSDEIEALKSLNISSDTNDYVKALKILQSLKKCLVEMRTWF